MIIPVEIDNQEVLVRFIFSDDFKKNPPTKESFKEGEAYMDTRGTGVSLQRGEYTNVLFCKSAAENINNKEFVGFLFFNKESYLLACSEMKQIREKFQSELSFTPLDNDGNYLIGIENIDTDQVGNPSHTDIFYIDPSMMMLKEEQTPKVALRLFSKKLCAKSKLLLPWDQKYIEHDFTFIFDSSSYVFLKKEQK